MSEGAAEALRLFAWLSPGYPVGAYAYSHGLEAAVEAATSPTRRASPGGSRMSASAARSATI